MDGVFLPAWGRLVLPQGSENAEARRTRRRTRRWEGEPPGCGVGRNFGNLFFYSSLLEFTRDHSRLLVIFAFRDLE